MRVLVLVLARTPHHGNNAVKRARVGASACLCACVRACVLGGVHARRGPGRGCPGEMGGCLKRIVVPWWDKVGVGGCTSVGVAARTRVRICVYAGSIGSSYRHALIVA